MSEPRFTRFADFPDKSFFAIILLLAFAAYGQQQERVAIINTVDDRDSIGFSDLNYLTVRFREAAVNVLPKSLYAVMSMQSIVDFLGSEERAQKECKESSCLADLGRKVNANYVAQARIGRFDNNLSIGVELYSSKSGAMVGSFTGNSPSISGLLTIIDEKAPALFKKMPGVDDDEPDDVPSITVAQILSSVHLSGACVAGFTNLLEDEDFDMARFMKELPPTVAKTRVLLNIREYVLAVGTYPAMPNGQR